MSTSYDVRRERMARLLAASLMGLVKDPAGDRLPDECWKQMLAKADSIFFIVSQPGTTERRISGKMAEEAVSARR